jgi:hypothetical protein
LKWSREIWAKENARVFDGKLPRPIFVIKKMDDYMGLWDVTKSGKHRIAIDPRECSTKKSLHPVMLHEMIHQLQWMQKSPRTQSEHHGRFFQRHVLRIFCEISIMPTWTGTGR